MSKENIRRAKHGKETPYFSMSRATAQNKSLSYEARGMLCYLLSKPDDWEVHINDLILKEGDNTKTGKSKVYSILSELADAGYIVKPKRYTDDKGRIQWTPYEVYEQPVDSSKSPYSDLPDMVSPDMAEPYTEKPDNNIKENTEHFAKEENITENNQSDGPRKPTPQEATNAVYPAIDERIAEIHQALNKAAIIVSGPLLELIHDTVDVVGAAPILEAIEITRKRSPNNPAGYLKKVLEGKRAEQEAAIQRRAEDAIKQSEADKLTAAAQAQTLAILRGETPPVIEEVDHAA